MLRKLTRFTMGILVSGTMLASSVEAAFNAQLQGQSFGSTNWISSNLSGWHELDLIPMRVYLTGGPSSGKVITVQFDHSRSSGKLITPGVQNLSQFVASSNVTITASPTLTDKVGDVWAYSFTVSVNDNKAGYVEFRARLGAGAHNFPGSSLAVGGSPSLGNLQIAKPAAALGDPDLAITKLGPASANAGDTISYNLTYTNRAGTAGTGAQVTDILPGGVTLVSCSGGCTLIGDEIVWDIGDVNSANGGLLTYQVMVDAGAMSGLSFTNHAQVLSAENDANYSNNVAEVVTTVASGCVAPSIVSDPQSATNCSGQSITFNVAANGTSLRYQWRKDSANIAGATNSSYTISSPTVGDAGSYDAVISNTCGSVTSAAATLSVSDNTPPVLGNCPADISVNNDAGVCSAKVTFTAPTATDNCGSATVSCAPASGSDFPKGASLVTCTATDDSGNTASCTFNVTVADNESPVPTCPSDITVSTEAGQCTADVSFSASVSDNCPGATIACVPASGSTFAMGAHSVTCTATDASGNTGTCGFSVIVNDTEAPVATCPNDITVSTDAGKCTADVSFGASVSDNCSGASIACVPASGSTFDKGTTSVACTATDASGNTSSCSFNVTVNDTELPAIICPSIITVACDSEIPAADVSAVSASDNCSGVTVVHVGDVSNGMSCPETITRTYKATDASGNEATCTQTIMVNDDVAPMITCPSDIELDCGASTEPANTGTATATDNCTANPAIRYTDEALAANCTGRSGIQRTWKATDDCGNEATCVQTITFKDTTAPVLVGVPADGLVECSSVPAAAAVTATDNCDANVSVQFSEQKMDGNCPSSYTLARTWTATDACGNTASATQTIVVQDTIAPTIVCPSNIVVECDLDVPAADINTVIASDNCGSVSIVHMGDVADTNLCPKTITRTYKATDSCGNASQCEQTITILDTIAPIITCPANMMLDCDESSDPEHTGAATATDNCDPAPAISYSDEIVEGGIQRTWKATDLCGNEATCVQILVVADLTAPTITCPADVQVQCGDSTDPSNTGTATGTDNCATAPTITFTDAAGETNCTGHAAILRTWTATDAAGNFTNCIQTISFVDAIAPMIQCPANIELEYGASTDVSNTGNATASDNCGGQPAITHSDAPIAANCTGRAGIERTFTATDACGNVATCVQSITFKDTTAPSITCPANAQVECGASTAPASTGSATATDDCDGNPTITHSDTAMENGIQRTWKATDVCGNESTCVQTITIVDTTAPSITCPADITVNADAGECTASGVALGLPTASDICGSVALDHDAPNAFPKGMTTVTWTATDAKGNTATCTQTVTVLDNQPPVITCPADVAVSTDEGKDTASNVNLGSPTASDNCGSLTITNNAPSEFPIGTTTVTWTATDSSGNSATCQQRVSVGDTQPPTFPCPETVVVEAERMATNAVITYTTPVVSDNTGVQSISCEPQSGSTFPIGTNAITCTAIDIHGNSADCSFDAIVEPFGGGQAGGPSDVDLYVSKGAFQVNRTASGADRLIIKGKMNPRGCAADLSGATITIRVNGKPVLGPQPLLAKGSFAAANGKGKFSCKNGKYAFSLSALDLAEALGLPNVTGTGLVPVTIEVEIENAGLATPVVTGEFEFAYKSAQNKATSGKFSFKKNRTLTGAYNLNRFGAKMIGNGYGFSALGPILLDGSMPVVPTDDVILIIGGQELVIPFASLVRTGADDATSIYTYDTSSGAVPGLVQFVLDNKKKAFRVMTSELDGAGLPMPGNGKPTAHDLEFSMDLITSAGNMVAESIVEPKRKSPTTTSWKR